MKKHPVAIVGGALCVLLLAGIYLRSSKASEMAATLKQKEEEGQRILDNIRSGANLAEQYETLATATKELEARLVRGPERARNQQYFYRLESETGVKEISLQPVTPPPLSAAQQRLAKALYAGVGYTVSVQGDYRQILDFVGRLESGPHFYRMVSASVSRPGQRGTADATNAINLTLNLELLGLQ
ncbi:MAG TPA: hypothetical protein VLT83_01975 [Opitutaceae bacterium]|nr:hypothetical protein [Opitutaceae bacterium]